MHGQLNVKFETCVRLCSIFYINIFVLLLKHNGDFWMEASRFALNVVYNII